MPEVITDNIDLWSSALLTKSTAGRGSNGRVEAYGIKKLRELILELAVRGKLVPQDSDDEDVQLLLTKNDTQRREIALIDRRADANLQPILSANDCWEIPESWGWRGLADLVLFVDYRGRTPDKLSTGIRLLTAKNVRKGQVDLLPEEFLSEQDYTDWMTRGLPKAGDVLFTTEAPMGNAAVVELTERFALAQRVICFQGYGALAPAFLVMQILSCKFQFILDKNGTGMTAKGIKASKLKQLPIAIPPLAEQHRIVTKVDELMALCDQLEQQQTSNIEAHQTLVETLLGTLTNVESQEEFTEAWTRIANHFDTLFTTEQSIDQLKQTILQLAVMGKLVPQDPNDELASVLLQRVESDRVVLFKAGKIKKLPNIPTINTDELSFELPKGWDWGLIPQVVSNDKYAIKRGPFGSAIKKDYFVPTGYKVYEQQHAIKDDFSLGDYYIDQNKFNELKAFEVKPNDMIISCSGTVGKVAVAPEWMEPGVINQALLKISLNEEALTNDYFKILFPAFYMKTNTLSELQGTAQKNMVSVETLKEEPFPLPPLAEQHRIVAKVDEIMALCDTLKTRLTDAQTTQIHLADTIVEQAVA